MKYLQFLNEAAPDPALLGGKGSNLVRLVKIGVNVPPSFIITAASYIKFLKESKNKELLEELLSRNLQPKDVVSRSRSIRKLILESEFPEDVEKEVRTGFDKIRKESGTGICFAARSSATIEGMNTFSFAGQSDTFLNNSSFNKVLSSVRNRWASLFSLQALAYFIQMEKLGKKYSLSDLCMAVVVQKMVNSEISGVLFTVSVMNNNRDEMMINSTWGLGDAIVNNSVTPDMVILDKSNFNHVVQGNIEYGQCVKF